MVLAKKSLATLILFLLLTAVCHADVIDRVVAIVNDDVITLSEVNEEGNILLKRMAESVPPAELPEAMKQIRQNIIEKLVEKKIMLQEAEKEHLSVTDEEVDLALKRILELNHATLETFRSQLSEMGMSESQYRENLKSQVLSSKLVNQEIRSKVIIPEDRVIDYYDSHYTERVGEGGYYLLQIGISWGTPAENTSGGLRTREAAKKKVEQVRQLAIEGKDFRELARNNSDLPSAADGGDIGILNEDDMSQEMQDIISRTKPGEVTPVIETSSGFQFFKVLSSKEGQIITKVSYESVKDEIHEILYQQEMEARYTRWLEEKKRKAYIKIL